ncbi:glutathione peroxidase [Geomicrobium sp. JCM 19039]|uniref:glutathione peroxidase n=1 Tax=Geomicrobium sp. JCM 19039 TaxID=1460636 RepID=UPI00045F28F0|nr:glutathione peroxidase [Geomicrobium sp. JCM 19039]GAK11893.1 glutathione peroxidase family protein [Geomicrobium sp. JCM 19039]
MSQIYEVSVESLVDGEYKLEKYQGCVLLIVNTASRCGFAHQLTGLQELYERYKDDQFQILAFPSNQFVNQEPLNDEEIPKVFQEKYGVTFPIFKKIFVRGANIHPLYDRLTTATKGVGSSKIKWNFTKFLIDRHGKVVERYGPGVSIERIEDEVVNLLG